MQEIEQAIEEMTQEGYQIYRVEAWVYDKDKGGIVWESLDTLKALPEGTTIWLWSKRADGTYKDCTAYCTDMKRLMEWYKGGWQANI